MIIDSVYVSDVILVMQVFMSGRSGVLFARCCTPDNLYAKLNLNKSSYGVKIYKLIRNKNNVCAYGVVVDIRLTTYRHGGERWLSGRLAFLLRCVVSNPLSPKFGHL